MLDQGHLTYISQSINHWFGWSTDRLTNHSWINQHAPRVDRLVGQFMNWSASHVIQSGVPSGNRSVSQSVNESRMVSSALYVCHTWTPLSNKVLSLHLYAHSVIYSMAKRLSQAPPVTMLRPHMSIIILSLQIFSVTLYIVLYHIILY